MAKTKEASEADDDKDFLAEALDRYTRGYDKDRENIDEALIDLGFMTCRAEDQWPAEAISARKGEGRPILTMPQVPKFVRQVTGDMRISKPGIKVVAVDNQGDEKTADVMAGLIRYIENRSAARFAYTKAADSQVAAGIGHLRVLTEYASTTTFNQELRIVGVDDGVMVIWDPDAILPTREDAMYCFVPIDMSNAQFKKRFPDASPSDFGDWSGWISGEMTRVAEYWEKRPEKRLLALLPDGAVIDLTDKPEEERAKYVDPEIKVEERDSFCVYRSLICAGTVLEEPTKWPGRYIPVIPVIGEEVHFGRETVRRGIIRSMRDAQRLYNYAMSAQAEVTALQPKAPWLVTDAQIKKYIPEWESANHVNRPYLRYTVEAGSPPPSRVQPPVSSQGIAELIERASQDMRETTGIYDAGLGAKSNETSGKAIIARQREADVGTFVYMDNWGLSIEHVGRVLVDLIPKIYDTQRMIRILGEDGKVDTIEVNKTVMAPMELGGVPTILNDVTVGAYDVQLQTGPAYSTRREEAKEGMIELLRSVPEVGQGILDLVAEAQDWPQKDKIAKRIRAMMPPRILQADEHEGDGPPPPPEPDPMQEMAGKLELAGKAADIDKTRAETANKQADTQAKLTGARAQQLQTVGAFIQPQADPQQEQIVEALSMISQQLNALTQALGLNRAA